MFTKLFLLLLPLLAAGQLSGRVGPTTSYAAKKNIRTCNIATYGAVADGRTDAGPAISAAAKACINGGVVVIPNGNYALGTFVTITNPRGLALQLDGILTRTGTGGGNMITISGGSDFEFLSSTGKGAVQGNGYIFHRQGNRQGPRILRLVRTTNFSVHDLAFVDAPAFHMTLDTCSNAEVYNMAIRGANEGGLDGVDVWGTNIHVHDVMVTNKDECVTVKSPAHNFLIENIYCNWSGGSAIGSLSGGTDISNILYRKVYTWMSNQMMLIKSNGGSGSVRSVTFDQFIGHGNAYSLDIDQYWSSLAPQGGKGVQLTDITFSNWKGTEANGVQRGPIKVVCSDGAPCTGIKISDFAMWTEAGNAQTYTCRSSYGSGGCLKAGAGGAYGQTVTTIRSPPAGYQAPTMPYDLKQAFGTTDPIPIPEHPASYYPGTPPISRAP